jgi:transposase-like protein
MKQKRHKTEEIIRILRQADGEQTVETVCREHNISEQTFYRPPAEYAQRAGETINTDRSQVAKLTLGLV